MKTIRSYKVNYVVPENEKEERDIKRIIAEVREEDRHFDPSQWKPLPPGFHAAEPEEQKPVP